MTTRKKFKHSLKVLSTLHGRNIKDCHVEAILDVVDYVSRFIDIHPSEKENHVKATFKYDLEENGIPINDFLNNKDNEV